MRLSKYIFASGVCSRRQASRLIKEGRVTVNERQGLHIDRVGNNDVVLVDDELVTVNQKRYYFLYNKPVGVDSVCNPDNPSSIVYPLRQISNDVRLFPVGRLDKDSHGLMLLTNDGALCQTLMHPDYFHEKEYRVTVNSNISAEFIDQLSSGVCYGSATTGFYQARPCRAMVVDSTTFHIVLTEGKNRQIRRMCQSLGYKVTGLQRIRIMHLHLLELAPGAFRELSVEEIQPLTALLP